MSETGYLQQSTARPGSLVTVIAFHLAAVTALMLAKGEYERRSDPPLVVRTLPQETPPPPDKPRPEPKQEVRQKTAIDQVPPIIKVDRPAAVPIEKVPDFIPTFDPGPVGNVLADPVPVPEPAPQPVPVPEPVRKEAQMLASSELQPPYPAAEQRAENEGSVTIRVLIGTDGRVKAVEKIRAASDAFFRATEQQALRHWRFKPATVDGKPVEARKVMTVHFRLAA